MNTSAKKNKDVLTGTIGPELSLRLAYLGFRSPRAANLPLRLVRDERFQPTWYEALDCLKRAGCFVRLVPSEVTDKRGAKHIMWKAVYGDEGEGFGPFKSMKGCVEYAVRRLARPDFFANVTQ